MPYAIQCTIVYSCVDKGDDQLHHRIRLDRRHFESAHLKYAMLMTKSRYPSISIDTIPMTTDVTDSLQKFTPMFYNAFSDRYSGKLSLLIAWCRVLE